MKNHNEWENFVLKQPYTIFVQSYHYGEFYRLQGEQYWIIGIYEANELIGGSLVLTTHAKRGNFFYLPYGPILPERGSEEALQMFLVFVRDFAKKKSIDFIRACPFADNSTEGRGLWNKHGFRSAPMHMIAETTWLLDIRQSEERLMADMKKNHRNLIRRCEREGASVTMDTDPRSLADFNRLHDHTAKHHQFTRFSKEYIEREFSSFASHGQAVLCRAYLPDGRLDSAAIIIFYGTMACYRHGASQNLNNKIPTSYLIQWRAIEEAKKRGMMWYNFWGIAPLDASENHPFKGITHFKTGFGGGTKNLLRCQDLPISGRYWVNWVVETWRRKKRGF